VTAPALEEHLPGPGPLPQPQAGQTLHIVGRRTVSKFVEENMEEDNANAAAAAGPNGGQHRVSEDPIPLPPCTGRHGTFLSCNSMVYSFPNWVSKAKKDSAESR